VLLPIFLPARCHHDSLGPRFFALPARTHHLICMASSASLSDQSLPTSLPGSAVQGSVRSLLRLEGLAVAALTFVLYARTGANWWLFAALWLVPISPCSAISTVLLGRAHLQRRAHIRSARGGRALCAVLPHRYAAAHRSYLDQPHRRRPPTRLWLKYSNGFGWTHLGRLGKQRESIQAS